MAPIEPEKQTSNDTSEAVTVVNPAEYFALAERQNETFPVGDAHVRLQKLCGHDLITIAQFGGEYQDRDESMLAAMALSIVDDNGKRLYDITEEDFEALGNMVDAAFKTISGHVSAYVLGGLDPAELKKS